MANTSTTLSTGVSTTSMFLTPQAVDDFYAIMEGNQSDFIFDVMSNDLGGNAKTLYSITTGSESNLDAAEILDLQTVDIAGVYELTEKGATAAIVNGKIVYNTTTIAATINALANGQVFLDHITYAIRLGNGTLSLATVEIKITGTNDQGNRVKKSVTKG